MEYGGELRVRGGRRMTNGRALGSVGEGAGMDHGKGAGTTVTAPVGPSALPPPMPRGPLAQPPRPHLASTRRPRPQRRRQPVRWKRGTRAPSEHRRAIRCAWQVATPSAPAATNLKKAPQQSAFGRGRGRRADSDERREPETESRKRDYEAGRRIISTRRWAAQ
jgi:hypothetical protein